MKNKDNKENKIETKEEIINNRNFILIFFY